MIEVLTSNNDPEKSEIGLHNGKGITFESALTIIGYGKYNIFITLACGIALFAVNTSIYGVAYILPAAECDMQLDTAQKGIFTAVSFIGVMCSLHIWGALADTKGRRKIILISLLSSFVCNLISILVTHFWVFIILQFLKGVFIAGSSSALYSYLGEFHTNDRRSGAIAWITLFMAIALTALPISAWIVLQQTFSINIFNLTLLPWRLYLFLCSVPNILAAALITRFPESPKYLILENRMPEVLEILKNMFVANTNLPTEACPIKPLEDSSKLGEVKKSQFTFWKMMKSLWYQTVPLFYRENIKYTAMTCVLQFGSFATSSGLLLWYPHILNKMSEAYKYTNATLTLCQALETADQINQTSVSCENLIIDSNVFLQNTIIGGAYCVGCFSIGVFINWIGNRPILVINMLVAGVCCFLLTIVTSPLAIEILFVAVLVQPGLCIGIINAVVINIFPTHYKTMAVSMALIMGRLGGASSSSTIGLMLEQSCEGTMYFYGILSFGCLFLSILIPKK